MTKKIERKEKKFNSMEEIEKTFFPNIYEEKIK